MKYERIQVIWDHDHGSANEGWYVRVRHGLQEEDMRTDLLEPLAHDASDSDLRSAAIEFLFGSVGEQEDAALHSQIEVKR